MKLFLSFLLLYSLQDFVKGCGGVTKRWVDQLLDKMTGGDHSKAVSQIRQVWYSAPATDIRLGLWYDDDDDECYFTFQKRNMMLKPDETKSNNSDMQVGHHILKEWLKGTVALVSSDSTVWYSVCFSLAVRQCWPQRQQLSPGFHVNEELS